MGPVPARCGGAGHDAGAGQSARTRARRGLAVATTPEEDADQTRVQVWSLADRRLLQRTPDTPDAPFVADFKPGYATSDSGGQTWRVYALNDASGRVQVQAAKPPRRCGKTMSTA